MIEPVRHFAVRYFQRTGKILSNAEVLRETKHYHEVMTSDITEEMERWLVENANADDYYYCMHNIGMFTPSWMAKHGCVVWFFDTRDTAAMFKLMFGQS